MKLDDIRTALAPFLEANSKSEVVEEESDGAKAVRVVRPWGDPSLSLMVPEDPSALIDALNNVVLPERFSAIWHRDTKRLEVIWTAFGLAEDQKEIANRKFTFEFKRKKHSCEFGLASNRLLALAD